MKITEDFLALGLDDGVLNKSQLALVGEGEEMSVSDANMFLFLRGKFSLRVQKQIIENYHLVAEFHKNPKKDKVKVKTNINTLTIYCDGACKGNPGRAGSGLAVYDGGDKPTLWYGEYTPKGTNNTAELHALYQALLFAKDAKKAVIYSDSKYSIDCISLWAYGWKKKGWTKKAGEIKNLALIQSAHSLYEALKNTVSIKHVKGHSGVEGNELADRMAVYAIAQQSLTYRLYDYESVSAVLALRTED